MIAIETLPFPTTIQHLPKVIFNEFILPYLWKCSICQLRPLPFDIICRSSGSDLIIAYKWIQTSVIISTENILPVSFLQFHNMAACFNVSLHYFDMMNECHCWTYDVKLVQLKGMICLTLDMIWVHKHIVVYKDIIPTVS